MDVRGCGGDEAARILARCDELARISDEDGRITRGFLSDAMKRATALVEGWMRRAGMRTEIDAAGNLIGLRPGHAGVHRPGDLPVLVLGSHLDTVRDAGRYDGVLGVLLAVEVARQLQGRPLPFDLEVVAFSDEEGLRYGVPFLGSRALIGQLDPALLDLRDESGTSMADAIRSWGGDPSASGCRYAGRRTLGYFEAHIEQGPWLEHQGLPVAVLEAIAAACWLRLRFHGRAGHAGTTPMELRLDPMPAAAEVVLAAERLALDEPGLVATVGKLSPAPGAGNVIAGSVELRLDLRHPASAGLASALDSMLGGCREIAARRGLRIEHEILHRQESVDADPRLSALLADAVAAADTPVRRLAVGAGHDALIMARVMPVTMLLLRCAGGVSHHPDEAVSPADVDVAVAAAITFVERLSDLETLAPPPRSGREDIGDPKHGT